MGEVYKTERGTQREIKLVSESRYSADRTKRSPDRNTERTERYLFKNGFESYMPKSTVDHLDEWGETSRIFEESVTGFESASYAHVKEYLTYTGTNVIDTDQSVKRVYSFIRRVTNERNEEYPYFDKDGLAIVRECNGEYGLRIFDDGEDMCKWVSPLVVGS